MYMYMYNLFWGELERRKREGGREGGRDRQVGRTGRRDLLLVHVDCMLLVQYRLPTCMTM